MTVLFAVGPRFVISKHLIKAWHRRAAAGDIYILSLYIFLNLYSALVILLGSYCLHMETSRTSTSGHTERA